MIRLELHYFTRKEQPLWQFCKLCVAMFNKLGEKVFLFCTTCTVILISDPVILSLSLMALHFVYASFLLPTSSFGGLIVLNLVHWRLLWCCSKCLVQVPLQMFAGTFVESCCRTPFAFSIIPVWGYYILALSTRCKPLEVSN